MQARLRFWGIFAGKSGDTGRKISSVWNHSHSERPFHRALDILTVNMKLHPNSPNAYDSLAECYLTMGDKEKAKTYYGLAIQKNPGKTDYEKRILQNSKDKLRELSR